MKKLLSFTVIALVAITTTVTSTSTYAHDHGGRGGRDFFYGAVVGAIIAPYVYNGQRNGGVYYVTPPTPYVAPHYEPQYSPPPAYYYYNGPTYRNCWREPLFDGNGRFITYRTECQ